MSKDMQNRPPPRSWYAPIRVDLQPGIAAMASGQHHAPALTGNGWVVAWVTPRGVSSGSASSSADPRQQRREGAAALVPGPGVRRGTPQRRRCATAARFTASPGVHRPASMTATTHRRRTGTRRTAAPVRSRQPWRGT